MLRWIGIAMFLIFCALGVAQFLLFILCFFFSKEEKTEGIFLVVTRFSALDEGEMRGRNCPKYFLDQSLSQTKRDQIEKRGFWIVSPDTPLKTLWEKENERRRFSDPDGDSGFGHLRK